VRYSVVVNVTDTANEQGFYEAEGAYTPDNRSWTTIGIKSFGRSQERAIGFFLEDLGKFLKTSTKQEELQ
jgi:hypothetical protein